MKKDFNSYLHMCAKYERFRVLMRKMRINDLTGFSTPLQPLLTTYNKEARRHQQREIKKVEKEKEKMIVSPGAVCHLGLHIVGYKDHQIGNCISTDNRRFRANYGVGWNICSNAWNMLWEDNNPIMSKRCVSLRHLFWCLILMKSYNSESKTAGNCNMTEKTLQKSPEMELGLYGGSL